MMSDVTIDRLYRYYSMVGYDFFLIARGMFSVSYVDITCHLSNCERFQETLCIMC